MLQWHFIPGSLADVAGGGGFNMPHAITVAKIRKASEGVRE